MCNDLLPSVGGYNPALYITPEPHDVASSPDKSPDVPKRPHDVRMLSPERFPIFIHKYARSPDMKRRFDSHMKTHSPDVRRRSIEGISSLPELKEGSPEMSADDLQTPEQSPEHYIMRDIVVRQHLEEEEEDDETSYTSLEESPKSFSSIKISVSQEGSPESKSIMPRGQIVSEGIETDLSSSTTTTATVSEREASPQQDRDLESSCEAETHSAHASKLLSTEGYHSKSSSMDARGGGRGDSSSHELSKLVFSSSSQPINSTTHLKTASDDMTGSSATKKDITEGSGAASKSLTGIDHMRIQTSKELNRSSSPSVAGSEDGEISSHNRDSIEKYVEGRVSGEEFPTESTPGDAVISPTLRIVQKLDDEEEREHGDDQAIGEDTLFDMLNGRNAGGEEKEVLAGKGKVTSTEDSQTSVVPSASGQGEEEDEGTLMESDADEEKDATSPYPAGASELEAVDPVNLIDVEVSCGGRTKQGTVEPSTLLEVDLDTLLAHPQPSEHGNDDGVQTVPGVDGKNEGRIGKDEEKERVVDGHGEGSSEGTAMTVKSHDHSTSHDHRSAAQAERIGGEVKEGETPDKSDHLEDSCEFNVTWNRSEFRNQDLAESKSSYDSVIFDVLLTKGSTSSDHSQEHPGRNPEGDIDNTFPGRTASKSRVVIVETTPPMEGRGPGRGSHDLDDDALIESAGDDEHDDSSQQVSIDSRTSRDHGSGR